MSVPFVNQVDRYSLLIQKCFELVGQKCRIGFEAKPYHNIDAYRKSVYREVYDIFLKKQPEQGETVFVVLMILCGGVFLCTKYGIIKRHSL